MYSLFLYCLPFCAYLFCFVYTTVIDGNDLQLMFLFLFYISPGEFLNKTINGISVKLCRVFFAESGFGRFILSEPDNVLVIKSVELQSF